MAKKKSDGELIIIGRDFSEKKTRGDNKFDEALKIGKITSERLKTELTGITNSIGGAIEKINLGLEHYALDEISIKLELTTEGKIGILGSGVSASGTGGIELKFKFKP